MPSSNGEYPTGLFVSQRLTLHLYKMFYLFLILTALVFVAARRPSLAVVSVGFSLRWSSLEQRL